jgi:VIT family
MLPSSSTPSGPANDENEPVNACRAPFTAGDAVRDVVIGMSDGLTVPFALAAGLSGAVSSTHIIVAAGIAEIAAGSIAMGLGGYLAARSDAEHYASELAREEREIVDVPDVERREVADVLATYGVTATDAAPRVERWGSDSSPPDQSSSPTSAWIAASAHVCIRIPGVVDQLIGR